MKSQVIAGRAILGGMLAIAFATALRADDPAPPVVTGFEITPVRTAALTAEGYTVVPQPTGDGSLEFRCHYRGRHFMSVLRDNQGGLAVRPHPGVDVNGWGTTLYVQPTFSGIARVATEIGGVVAQTDGIRVTASGTLRNGANVLKGDWTLSVLFSYDPEGRKGVGNGDLKVTLHQPLAAGEDIDVVKFASNYLHDVPLLTGGNGDTGDTTGAHYSGSALAPQFWDPVAQPGHYPQEHNDWLDIKLTGCHNLVDTARQPDPEHPGEYIEPIAAAFKPSVRLRMALQQAGQSVPFMFGAAFAEEFSRDFASDNVSVTPQIRHFAALSEFDFELLIESAALEEDGNRPDTEVSAVHEGDAPTLGVYHSPLLTPAVWQRIGSLKRRPGPVYSATLKAPDGPRGFIRAVSEDP